MARTTLILSRGDFLARAECAGSGATPRVDSFSRVEVPRDASLPERVEAVLRVLGPPSKRTFLITDDAFAATIDLDARAARGLKGRELDSALACEAQLSSGLGADDAVLTARSLGPSGSVLRYRIVEFARHEFATLEGQIESAGGRLGGIAHPDDVPLPVPAANQDGGELDAAWNAWIEAAAAGIGDGRIPLVLPPSRPWSVRSRAIVGGLVVVLVLVAAWFDHARLVDRRVTVNRELALARAPLEEMSAIQGELLRFDAELRDLRSRLPRPVEAAGPRWKSHIPVSLVAALADERPSGVLIESFAIAAHGGAVEGIATRVEVVDELLDVLERRLVPHGVSLVLASRRLIEEGERAGLYRFRLAIQPIGRDVAAGGGAR